MRLAQDDVVVSRRSLHQRSPQLVQDCPSLSDPLVQGFELMQAFLLVQESDEPSSVTSGDLPGEVLPLPHRPAAIGFEEHLLHVLVHLRHDVVEAVSVEVLHDPLGLHPAVPHVDSLVEPVNLRQVLAHPNHRGVVRGVPRVDLEGDGEPLRGVHDLPGDLGAVAPVTAGVAKSGEAPPCPRSRC